LTLSQHNFTLEIQAADILANCNLRWYAPVKRQAPVSDMFVTTPRNDYRDIGNLDVAIMEYEAQEWKCPKPEYCTS
jgi:hypothetical protein